MSLKAKLEAVIYAAEEPVTLAQLSALFAAEALEWKAEQAAANAVETAGEAAPENEALPLGLIATGDAENEAELEPAAKADGAEDTASADEEAFSAAGEQTGTAQPAEAEERKQARQREREIRSILRGMIDELMAQCEPDDRGVEIREIAGGYRVATKVECHDAVRMFVRSLKPAMRLSLPALETLAVIAYKQPVTAPEVNEIRGVDSSAVFGSLLARKLIATAGRKQVIGRPILYKTTREFLLRFGLKDVSELPSMEEFEKMAVLELEEPETPDEPETQVETETAIETAGETHPNAETGAEGQPTPGADLAPAGSDAEEMEDAVDVAD